MGEGRGEFIRDGYALAFATILAHQHSFATGGLLLDATLCCGKVLPPVRPLAQHTALDFERRQDDVIFNPAQKMVYFCLSVVEGAARAAGYKL